MRNDVKQGFLPRPARTAAASVGERDGWGAAVRLTGRWLERGERTDTLLEGLAQELAGVERGRAQELFFGVVRWWSRLEAALGGLIARAPRLRVRAVLLVAGFELWDAGRRAGGAIPPETLAKAVHFAVERTKTLASPAEARLVNAVLRKLAERLQAAGAAPAGDDPAALAFAFAHPEWLVRRWIGQFGVGPTRQLLEWNQQPAPVHVRWRQPGAAVPEMLKPTRWPDFYEVVPGHWDEVRRLAAGGALYVQDPSTRLSVELLAPQAGELVLDGCAAPGGKSLLIADALRAAGGGRVVAVEQAGPRIDRLKENLARAPAGIEVALVLTDLRRASTRLFEEHQLPVAFPAVLVDVPCSNTGVIRHRIDIKWRLREDDFAQHAVQQLDLLRGAARRVAPGGRLVYSTCSLDAEENEGVVQRFLDLMGPAWELEGSALARPWLDGCDGAAAFRLARRK